MSLLYKFTWRIQIHTQKRMLLNTRKKLGRRMVRFLSMRWEISHTPGESSSFGGINHKGMYECLLNSMWEYRKGNTILVSAGSHIDMCMGVCVCVSVSKCDWKLSQFRDWTGSWFHWLGLRKCIRPRGWGQDLWVAPYMGNHSALLINHVEPEGEGLDRERIENGQSGGMDVRTVTGRTE